MTEESRRLATHLKRLGATHALLSAREDVTYVTGMDIPPPIDAGWAFSAGPVLALVDTDGATVLLTPAPYAGIAEASATADTTVVVDGFGHFAEVDPDRSLADAMRKASDELSLTSGSRVAVDPSTLPTAVREALPGDAEPVDVRPAVGAARRVKTAREIGLLTDAARVADAAQDAIAATLEPGLTELDLYATGVEAAFRAAGRPCPTAIDIVSGPRTAVLRYPGGPIERVLEPGDAVIVDFGVRVRGYWSDTTNTLVVGGEVSATQARYARTVRDALDAAVSALVPGARASDADTAATGVMTAEGLQPAHYTGHQLGTTVNEDPRLVRYCDAEIEADMVFALEPGVYEGEGGTIGARAERVVHVTANGPQVLSRFQWGITTDSDG